LELESIFGDEENNTRLSIMRELLEAISLYIGPDIEATELATVSFRRLKSLAQQIVELYETMVETSIRMSIERAKDIKKAVEDKNISEALEFLLAA
jgi:hypothetical protein